MDGFNNLMATSSGFCLLCTSKTTLVCHRCGDFYCSKVCQLKDWQRHRYICFSIPPLVHTTSLSALGVAELPSSPHSNNFQTIQKVEPEIQKNINVDELHLSSNTETSTESVNSNLKECDIKENNEGIKLENITCTDNSNETQKNADLVNKNNNVNCPETQKKADSANTQSIGFNGTQKKTDLSTLRPSNGIMPSSGSIVYVTEFMSPNRCYVRDACPAAEEVYLNICKKVNLMGMEQRKKLQIKPNEYALVNNNERFHRVKAISNKSGQLRLFYMDEGTIKTEKKIEIREICSELLEMPCSSLQVQLKDVPNFMLNNEVKDFLKKYVAHKFIATYSGTSSHVELRHVETQILLNAQICEFCSNVGIFDKQSHLNKTTDNQQVREKATYVSENSLAKCQMPRESIKKQTNIEQTNTKSQQPLKTEADPVKTNYLLAFNKDLILNKDKVADISAERNSNTNQNLKDNSLDSINSLAEENPTNIENVNPKSLKPIIVELSPVKTENLQATNSTFIFNNDKAVETSSKSNHDFKEIKLDSNLLTNENDKENKIIFTQSLLGDIKHEIQEKLVPIKHTSPLLQRQEPTSPKEIHTPDREPLLNPPFEIRRLNIGNKKGLDAIIVDNTNVSRGIVGAFNSIYSSDSSKVYSYLSEFKDSQPYKPILKEYIIAKYENSWYRAKVMEIIQNTYSVMYLDFTNVATVTEQDIRRYPTDLTVPCNTSVCLIEGFPHRPTKRQIDYLEEKLQMNSRFHIDSASYLQDMALIKCKTLIDELNKYK